MPCVDLFVCARRFVAWCFDCFLDCFPERLTTTLTVLEIVYYCVAIVYFLLELVVLCVTIAKG